MVRLAWLQAKRLCAESGLTWSRMNRRKADFKFAYKFLEDEV
jgi:hypothetical protein